MLDSASWARYQKCFQAWSRAATIKTATFLRWASYVYVLSRYGIFVSKVIGPSMMPTFEGQVDVVLAEAVTPLWGQLKPGDVVICTRPVDPAESIIKRVVALEGEEVILYPDRESSQIRRITVPPGHVWIQGDNPTLSLDSRNYGAMPRAMVRGRVILQLFPTIGWVDNSPEAVRRW